MARFRVTAAALSRLRELRGSYGPELVVAIYWTGPQADSRRRPDGSTEWARVVLGVLFLLSNFGWIPRLGPVFAQWWPVILIIVGLYLLVRR